VIIGVLLGLIGFEFILKSLEQLRSQIGVHYGAAAIAVTIFSILAKESMAQFAFWAGRKTDNTILKADGWHHRTDALSSVVVLVGIFFSSFFWWMDGVLGIIVALLIFYASYEILRDSINRLIGETPERELLVKIDHIVKDLCPEVNPHHFHLHRYGDHSELTFHITMAQDLTLKDAHEQAHKIEQALREKLDIEATIHMEPQGK
jgi:cation diffusion facilitator family transporter